MQNGTDFWYNIRNKTTPPSTAEVEALAEAYWPEKRIVTDRAISLTGDDFAEYIRTVPGV